MPDHVHVLLAHPAEAQRRERQGGLPEGKSSDDIRQARQPQVQVRQQEVLGGGLLRVHRSALNERRRWAHQGSRSPNDIALDKPKREGSTSDPSEG